MPGSPTFVTKDSGAREDFSTGSRRDTQDGKPRYDLLPVAALRRWAELMARGAEKYGERNWERGQPLSRLISSALRHLMQLKEIGELGGPGVARLMLAAGEISQEDFDALSVDEDHAAAVLFNVGAVIHHEAAIAARRLPAELDDREL